jgi:hypothetical protein
VEGRNSDNINLEENCGDQGGGEDKDNIVDNGVADALNASYEEVEDQSNKYIDFKVGERVKFSMHFNHPRFSIDYVCNFVLKSPVSGWGIVVHENFNIASIACSDDKTYNSAMKYCFKNTIESTCFMIEKLRM